VSPNDKPTLLLVTGRNANKGEAAISRSRVAHDRVPKQVYGAQQREKLGMAYLAIDPDEWISGPL
jgi:hypothetical protein